MIYQGTITKLLPQRTGKRNDGTTWTCQPFIFNQSVTHQETILLETCDTDIMDKLKEGAQAHIDYYPFVHYYGGKIYNIFYIKSIVLL